MSGNNFDAGYSLAISDTGNTLIAGGPSYNGFNGDVNSGMAQVFQYSNGS